MEDQLNDLTELHQHETGNLKQELASIEEKVAYQAYERARDIQVTTAGLRFKTFTFGLSAQLDSAPRISSCVRDLISVCHCLNVDPETFHSRMITQTLK